MDSQAHDITIHVTDTRGFHEWDFDPLTLRPLYNPDGTRKRACVGLKDDDGTFTVYEIMGVDHDNKTLSVRERS